MSDANSSSGVRLRPARFCDSGLLLEWANSSDSLANKKITSGSIPRVEHESWLRQRIEDPGTLLFMIEKNGSTVGQVRLQRRDVPFEIDIFITAEHRKTRIAEQATRAAVAVLQQIVPDARIQAWVRDTNIGSRRLFEKLKFTRNGGSGHFLLYEKHIAETGNSNER